MTARYETRRGERVLILDIPYRRPDGTSARYRRDSTAATLTAAREEDRRIRDRIAKTGSPFEEQAVEPPEQKKFSELVTDYRSTYLLRSSEARAAVMNRCSTFTWCPTSATFRLSK